jgi:hypothetical protein
MELCEAHPIKLLGDRGSDANGIRYDLYASEHHKMSIRPRIQERLSHGRPPVHLSTFFQTESIGQCIKFLRP